MNNFAAAIVFVFVLCIPFTAFW